MEKLRGKVVAIDGTKAEVHVKIVGEGVQGTLILVLTGDPGKVWTRLRGTRIDDECDVQVGWIPGTLQRVIQSVEAGK